MSQVTGRGGVDPVDAQFEGVSNNREGSVVVLRTPAADHPPDGPCAEAGGSRIGSARAGGSCAVLILLDGNAEWLAGSKSLGFLFPNIEAGTVIAVANGNTGCWLSLQ